MEQYEVILEAGDESSTGEFEEVLLASVVLLLLQDESGEPKLAKSVKVVAGESVKLTLWLEFMNGNSYC